MAKKSLEERIQCLEDIHEIQNLMSRYSYLHTAEMQEETVELWAKHTPGVRIEMAWGVYEGADAPERCYLVDHKIYPLPGAMHMHTLTTPVIEVAGDGKTAKGVWISPGHETSTMLEDRVAHWAWLKYGADFVKEDGKWKFWHLHVYGIFRCPYDKPWTEVEPPTWGVERGVQRHNDKPPTGQWEYTPTRKQELVPAPPEPYETFDEKTAY